MSKGRRQTSPLAAPAAPAAPANSNTEPATLTLTVREFSDAVPALSRIFNESRPLDVRLTYRLYKLRNALTAQDGPEAPHNATRRHLLETHGQKNDDGTITLVTDEARAAFDAEMNLVLAETLEVAGQKLTLAELGQLELKEPLTVNELTSIEWLITE